MCISTSGDSICFELYKSELIFEIRISIEVGDYKNYYYVVNLLVGFRRWLMVAGSRGGGGAW